MVALRVEVGIRSQAMWLQRVLTWSLLSSMVMSGSLHSSEMPFPCVREGSQHALYTYYVLGLSTYCLIEAQRDETMARSWQAGSERPGALEGWERDTQTLKCSVLAGNLYVLQSSLPFGVSGPWLAFPLFSPDFLKLWLMCMCMCMCVMKSAI